MAIFFQDIFVIGSDALASSYFNYVLIIPALSFFLIYRKREFLKATIASEDRPAYLNQVIGVSGLVISFIVYLYGAYTTYPLDYHLISLQIFLLSEVLLLFNTKVLRIVALPILLISTALPSIVGTGIGFWQQMSSSSAYVSYLALRQFGIQVSLTAISNAPSIQIVASNGGIYTFVVGVESSGIYSVVGFSLFALFVAYIAEGSVIRRIVLFGLGFPLLLLLNIARLVVIIGAAYNWGLVAFDIFHFSSGIVLVFLTTFALLVLGDKVFKLQFFPLESKPKLCPYCSGDQHPRQYFCWNCGSFLYSPKGSFSRDIFISILAIVFIFIIFMSSLSPAVAAAQTPGLVNLNSLTLSSELSLLPQIPGWNLSFVLRDTQIENILQQNAALEYSYTSTNSSSTNAQIFSTVQISSTIHTPEDSLVQFPLLHGGTSVQVIEDQNVEILDNPPLAGRMFIYNPIGSNDTVADFYWNVRSLFNFGSYSDYRNVQIGLVSTIPDLAAWGLVRNSTDYAGVTNLYLSIARYIANFWSIKIASSVVERGVQELAVPLIVVVLLCTVTTFSKNYFDKLKKSKLAKEIYNSLSPNDRELFQAIVSVSAKNVPTVEQIDQEYSRILNREIAPADVFHSLIFAEKLGLVKRNLREIAGRPVEYWQSLIDLK